MTDDMLGPSSMHIKYSSYVYDGPIFLVPLTLSYPSSPVLALKSFVPSYKLFTHALRSYDTLYR